MFENLGMYMVTKLPSRRYDLIGCRALVVLNGICKLKGSRSAVSTLHPACHAQLLTQRPVEQIFEECPFEAY